MTEYHIILTQTVFFRSCGTTLSKTLHNQSQYLLSKMSSRSQHICWSQTILFLFNFETLSSTTFSCIMEGFLPSVWNNIITFNDTLLMSFIKTKNDVCYLLKYMRNSNRSATFCWLKRRDNYRRIGSFPLSKVPLRNQKATHSWLNWMKSHRLFCFLAISDSEQYDQIIERTKDLLLRFRTTYNVSFN
jgi:hypothetical protein